MQIKMQGGTQMSAAEGRRVPCGRAQTEVRAELTWEDLIGHMGVIKCGLQTSARL